MEEHSTREDAQTGSQQGLRDGNASSSSVPHREAASSYGQRSPPPGGIVDGTDVSPPPADSLSDSSVFVSHDPESGGASSGLEDGAGSAGADASLWDRVRALESELEQSRQESVAHKDQALRALADLENGRRRMEREMADVGRYGTTDLSRDMLAILDNLSLALGSVDAESLEGAGRALFDGLRMVMQEMEGALGRHHVHRIDISAGGVFDPQHHQAIAESPSAEVPPGRVAQVVSQGYVLHDRLLRPARVIVAARGSVSSGANPEA